MGRLAVAMLVVALGSGCTFDAKKRRGFAAGGSLTFAGAYAASMATGAYYYRDQGSPAYFVPVIGPIWAAAHYASKDRTVSDYGDYGDVHTSKGGGGAALMGLWAVPLVSAQAMGLTLMMLALLSPESAAEAEVEAPVEPGVTSSLGVTPLPGGGSAAVLSGSF